MKVFEMVDKLEKWDELVKESAYGTIFHSSDWLTACSNLLNKKLKIYGCFEDNKLIGGCSLYIDDLKFFKKASSVVEMTPYGGIVLREFLSNKVRENEKIYNEIIKSLIEVVEAEQLYNIRLINSPGFIDLRPFIWNGWNSKILYAYYLKLDADIEKSLSKNVRWIIKKAIKNNIITKKLTITPAFYDLFSMTFERQGLKPPVTKNFFEKIIDLLIQQNFGEMWIAEIPSGEIISAEIIIYDNKRAYRWAAASHTDFRNLGATSLLLYDIFQDLKERGFKEINMMGANTPHLTQFLSAFNPDLIPYYEIEKSKLLFKFFRCIYKIYNNIHI